MNRVLHVSEHEPVRAPEGVDAHERSIHYNNAFSGKCRGQPNHGLLTNFELINRLERRVSRNQIVYAGIGGDNREVVIGQLCGIGGCVQMNADRGAPKLELTKLAQREWIEEVFPNLQAYGDGRISESLGPRQLIFQFQTRTKLEVLLR